MASNSIALAKITQNVSVSWLGGGTLSAAGGVLTIASVTSTTWSGTLTVSGGIISTAIGATGPSTGAFTTVGATGRFTSTQASGLGLYLHGSSTAANYLQIDSTGGNMNLGLESSVAGTNWTGSDSYATVLGTKNVTNLNFAVSSTVVGKFTITGLSVTGIASTSGNAMVGGTTDKTTLFGGSGTGLTVQGAAGVNVVAWDVANASYACYMGQSGANSYIGSNSGNLNLLASGATCATLTSTGLNSTVIGATTAAAGSFTTLSATGLLTVGVAGVNFIADFRGQGTPGAFTRFYDATNSATRGFLGYGSTLFTGGAVTDFGLRSEGDVILGPGGGAIVGRFSTTGLAVTGTISMSGGITQTAISNIIIDATSTAASALIKAKGSTGDQWQFGAGITSAGDWGAYNLTRSIAGLVIAGGSTNPTVTVGPGSGYGVFSSTGLAVTGTASATGQISSANNLKATGQVQAHAASCVTISQESASGSFIYAYGANNVTNGALTIVSRCSDGTNPILHTFSSTGVTLTGTLSISGNLSINSSRFYAYGADILNPQSLSDTTTTGITIRDGFILVGQVAGITSQFNSNTVAGSTLLQFLTSGTLVGSISTSAILTSYNTTSDYRLKNITGAITESGAFIDALKPCRGTWKRDGSAFVGFLAHEFQEVSPSSVTGYKDATDSEGNPIYQAMQASSAEVMANVISELQSLRARVAELEAA